MPPSGLWRRVCELSGEPEQLLPSRSFLTPPQSTTGGLSRGDERDLGSPDFLKGDNPWQE